MPHFAPEVRIQRREVNNPCLSVVKGGCSAPIASLAVQLIWCGVVYPFLPSSPSFFKADHGGERKERGGLSFLQSAPCRIPPIQRFPVIRGQCSPRLAAGLYWPNQCSLLLIWLKTRYWTLRLETDYLPVAWLHPFGPLCAMEGERGWMKKQPIL